jgi:MarR family multiple gene transcriptional regulator MgrA
MGSIEELIKQSKFKNESHKATVSLLYTANMLTYFHENFLGKFGLTLQQFNVLRILRGQLPNPATINLIRDRMMDKMSDASRIVERLRKAGFVERITSEKDRRAVDVKITDKGLEVLASIDGLQDEMDKPLINLNDAEKKQLNKLLDKILQTAPVCHQPK